MQSLTALPSTSRSRRWFSKSPAGPTSSSSPASEPPSRPPWPPRSSLNFFPCRSAAYIKMGQFTKAHQDAVKAKELNSEWPKVWQYKRWCWACLSIRIIVVLSIKAQNNPSGENAWDSGNNLSLKNTYSFPETLLLAAKMRQSLVWSMGRLFHQRRFYLLAFTALIWNSI